jgi:hypothetical protein
MCHPSIFVGVVLVVEVVDVDVLEAAGAKQLADDLEW